jgi:hypothetical protein
MNDNVKALHIKVSEYVIGKFNYHRLPGIALEALADGFDSESLRILAGLDENSSEYDVKYYFNRCIKELGYSVPEIKDAIWFLIKNVAQKIVQREIDEYDGGRLIYEYINAWPRADEKPDILWKFISCTSTIEDELFNSKETGRDYSVMINSEKNEIRDISEKMLNQSENQNAYTTKIDIQEIKKATKTRLFIKYLWIPFAVEFPFALIFYIAPPGPCMASFVQLIGCYFHLPAMKVLDTMPQEIIPQSLSMQMRWIVAIQILLLIGLYALICMICKYWYIKNLKSGDKSGGTNHLITSSAVRDD